MNVLRAHSVPQTPSAPANASLGLLTLTEAARELRCSRKRLCRITQGRVAGLPPLPVFHIGRRTFIRRMLLHAWIRTLEGMERENAYASGLFGPRDDEWECMAGA